MDWFACFICGENFSTRIDGKPTLVGFYVTRVVQASSLDEAESKALALLRSEEKLSPSTFEPSASARVYFEKIEKIAASSVDKTETGFVFFPMDTEEPGTE
jgi:hypothetical protein